MAVPTSPAGAAQWVADRWSGFLALEGRIVALQHAAAVARAQATQAGDAAKAALALEAIQRLGQLNQLHGGAVSTFQAVRDAVPGLGIIPVPLALAGTILALAGTVAFIFARVGAEERIVRLLEAGQLTPEQADSMLAHADNGGVGGGLQDAVQWVGLGVVAWFVVQLVRDRR